MPGQRKVIYRKENVYDIGSLVLGAVNIAYGKGFVIEIVKLAWRMYKNIIQIILQPN